jgi:formylmethanofuran dehydrogenase subunit E
MLARSVMLVLLGSVVCLAEEPMPQLPQPDYHRQAGDPDWLATVVQFHGHLGPAIVAGARMGMAGVRAVDAKGYFDVEVTCEGPFVKPPQSCFLDGVQVGTGATLGKRSLRWEKAEAIGVRVKNTRTGKTAEVRPTKALLDLLASFKPRALASETTEDKHGDEQLEAIARKVAAMPDKDAVTIRVTSGNDAPR